MFVHNQPLFLMPAATTAPAFSSSAGRALQLARTQLAGTPVALPPLPNANLSGTRLLPTHALAQAWLNAAAQQASALPAAPQLDVVVVGSHAASLTYVGRKQAAAARAGVGCTVHHLPKESTEEDLTALINHLNNSPQTHGIIVQLPLPNGLDAAAILAHIASQKDVDGLTPANQTALAKGQPGLVPATPLGVMRMLHWAGIKLENTPAVVVGKSRLVGAPMATLLRHAGAQVTAVDSQTPEDEKNTALRAAQLVVCAAGCPGLLTASNTRPNAVLIDVGLTVVEDAADSRQLKGDVLATPLADGGVLGHAGLISPVPGGVGPMTVASLITNVVQAATAQQNVT